MNKEYLYLLHLLKSFIHEEPPCAQDDIDWKKMNQLAEIHSVEGILGYMVKQYKLSPSPELQRSCARSASAALGYTTSGAYRCSS